MNITEINNTINQYLKESIYSVSFLLYYFMYNCSSVTFIMRYQTYPRNKPILELLGSNITRTLYLSELLSIKYQYLLNIDFTLDIFALKRKY